jgi:hypothetical protein
MPPEQASGREVSAQTDVYSVAMVLYEAITGRRWNSGEDPVAADWSGVPGKIARVLRGALAFDPENRWPDAATFRRKLWRTRVRRYQWRTAALTASGVAAGALGIWAFGLLTGGPGSGGLAVQLTQFQEEGIVPSGLTDLVTAFLVRGLSQSLEFQVCELEEPCDNPTVTLHGTVRVSESTLSVTVRTEDLVQYSSREGQAAEWMEVADLVAYDVLSTLWSKNSPLAEWLPLGALPTTTAGFNFWLKAERTFNEGRWGDAEEEYKAAELVDPTCYLCLWRLREIGRQHPGSGADDELKERIYRNKDSFPEWYQALIELASVAESERIPLLERAAKRWPDFFYLRFRWGEEIFNRGPLVGRSRSEAILRLEEALVLRPGFAPALEHLAWAAIAEGKQEIAERALAGLANLPMPAEALSGAYRLLIRIGFAYRFLGDEAGGDTAAMVLDIPGIEQLPQVVVSARWMPSFDAPNGAIGFGRIFVDRAQNNSIWELAGLTGQMFGHVAMGQLDSARARARDIRLDDFRLFAAQLDAFLLMFDPAGTALDRSEVIRSLTRRRQGAQSAIEEKRAAWTLSLLQRQAGDDELADGNRVLAGDSSDPLVVLLDAQSLAMAEKFDDALRLANTLARWERADAVSEDLVGPFFRTVVHLLRAGWNKANNNPEAARQQLLWHEGFDQDGYPMAEPMVEEVDWAFGTLARWRRAEVIENGTELCDVYRDIVRLWSKGDSVYAVRAKEARRKFDELGCEATSG